MTAAEADLHCCCEVYVGELWRRVIDIKKLNRDISSSRQSRYSRINSYNLQTIHLQLQHKCVRQVKVNNSNNNAIRSLTSEMRGNRAHYPVIK